MPIRAEMKDRYPDDWDEISYRIRFERAGGRCEECGAAHGWPHPETGSRVVLTTAHLDHHPENNSEGNLKALCQKCHNTYDGPKRAASRKHNALKAAGQLPFEGLEPPQI